MKSVFIIMFILLSFVCLRGQSKDIATLDSSFFKRNDTLFLKKSLMPFNGQLRQKYNNYLFYLNGMPADSSYLESDIWTYLVNVIFPLSKDTFLIDSRYKINQSTFGKQKFFYLDSRYGKSKIINIDTLTASSYVQIKIPDTEYYEALENAQVCPIGNHKDNIIPYLWGLPNKIGQRLIKKKKVIPMGCIGTGEGGQLYYCKKHQIDI